MALKGDLGDRGIASLSLVTGIDDDDNDDDDSPFY